MAKSVSWSLSQFITRTVEYLILIGQSRHPAVSYSQITTAQNR